MAAPASSRARAVGGDRLRRMCNGFTDVIGAIGVAVDGGFSVASRDHTIVTGYCDVPLKF